MTIDNETAQRIRSLLEARGYRIDQQNMHFPDGMPEEASLNYVGFLPDGKFDCWSDREENVLERLLVNLLNDKAQTDARQEQAANKEKSQVVVGPMQRNGVHGWGVWFNDHPVSEPIGFGQSIHEATNDFWLKVHGLEDPRRQMVA